MESENSSKSKLESKPSVRHKWPDRLFHWGMAVTVLVLLFSAFLPIAGIQFDWIPWHWIAGVCLTLLIIFHIVRALFFQGLAKMLPRSHDFKRSGATSKSKASPGEVSESSATQIDTKYDIFQKAYHWGTALLVLALIVTGIPMLIKLDTVLWDRNPGLLSDELWGYVYVVHGFASLALIFFVLLHIYFSLLPEHKVLLRSMITGKGPLQMNHDAHAGEQEQ